MTGNFRKGVAGRGINLSSIIIILLLHLCKASQPSGYPLPPNWVQYYHEGRAYYYNQIDGRRQWDFPIEELQTAAASQYSSPQQSGSQTPSSSSSSYDTTATGGGGRWYTAQDQNQRIYYVDSYTGTTTYTPPPELAYEQPQEGGVTADTYQGGPEAYPQAGAGEGGGPPTDAYQGGGLQETLAPAAAVGGEAAEGGGGLATEQEPLSEETTFSYGNATTPAASTAAEPGTDREQALEKENGELAKAKEELEREVEALKANLEKAEKEAEEAHLKAEEEAQAAQQIREQAEERERQASESLEALSAELERIQEEAATMIQREKTNETPLAGLLKNVTAERDVLVEQVIEFQKAQEADAKELEEAYLRFDELEGQYQQALDELQKLEDELRNEEEENGGRSSREQQQQKASRGAVAHVHGSSSSSSLLGRVVSSYVRSWIPARLKGSTAEEKQIQALNRTVFRLRENATALMDVIESRNDLIEELHQRIEVYEDEGVRRRRTVGSLREAISELTEEVNAKQDEIGLLRSELKEVVQELLWKEANVTTLEARAVLGEARAAGLEKELELAQADKARGLERAVNLTAQLQEAERLREEVEGEMVELRRQLEKEKAKVIMGVEDLNEERKRVGLLEEERRVLQEQVKEAVEAAGVALQKAELAAKERDEVQALSAERVKKSAVVHVPDAVITGKARGGKRKGWCWFGLF